jgi:hypothetical protein
VSARKLLALTAIVAALFAFIFLFERRMPSTAERQRKGNLYWDLPEDRLTGLTLTRGAETVEFTRTGGAPWRMVKPDPYPADAFAVNGAAGELTELKQASVDSAEARPQDYGLDHPVATATLVWTDAEEPSAVKTRTVEFGVDIPGTDITAARVAGQSTVLFVPSSALAAVKKPVDDFRSREVFGGRAADVSRLEILRGRGRLVLFRRDGTWWLSEPVADLADAGETDRLVGQLTGLRTVEFVHGGEDLAALSLQPPLYRVSLTGEKGAVTSVDFGATRSDGNSVYARKDGRIQTVDQEIVAELSKEAEPFRSATLVAFNRGDVTSVEADFQTDKHVLTRDATGWTSGGRPVLASAADDVLNAIAALKSKAFVDEAAVKALPAPASTVIVRTKTGPPWTIGLRPRAGELVATVSSRPGGFVVDGDVSGKLGAAFARAVTSPTPAPTKKP